MVSSWKLDVSATTRPSPGNSSACSASGRPDVAAHQHRAHLGAQQLAGQRGGGGLAVGAGDGDDVGLHHPPRQLELADDRHPAGAQRDERGQLERHPGAHDDQLRARERRVGMAARPERAAEALEAAAPPRAAPRAGSSRRRARGRRGGGSAAPPPPRSWRARPRRRSSPRATAGRRAPLAVTAHEDPRGIRDVPSQRDRDGHRMSPSAELQGGERQERQHERHDPETDDDLGLRPALDLVVMVQRRHLEDPLARSA